jgi:hypothetical protein
VAPSTGNIFQLNGTLVTQEEARATCNAHGGHLAIFLTMQEQVGAGCSHHAGLYPTTAMECGYVQTKSSSAVARAR